MVDQEYARKIYDKAIECGFDNCGIVPLSDLEGYDDRLTDRCKKVGFGGLFYVILSGLTKLKKRHPWAKSVVICVDWIGKYRFPESLQGKYGKAFMLSRNTVPEDKVCLDRIEFENWMKDNGIRWEGGEKHNPIDMVPMREAAVAAGLGIFRKNNFFYGEKGSYYNLEAYLIDKECVLKHETSLKPCPENCNICQNACKTKALSEPFVTRPMSCLSLWTTYGMNIIPPHLKKEQYEDWIFGCDNCQDACPHNKKHDWSVGEDFPGIDEDLITLMQPENILKASNKELREKVIPKAYDHIPPIFTGTVRRGAKRVINRHKDK